MFLEQQGCGHVEDMLLPGDEWLTTPSWHMCWWCGCCCGGGGGEEKDYSIVYLYTCIIGYLYDNSKIKNEKEERGQRQKKKLYREIGKIEYESCIVTVGTLILLILLCCVSCMIIMMR